MKIETQKSKKIFKFIIGGFIIYIVFFTLYQKINISTVSMHPSNNLKNNITKETQSFLINHRKSFLVTKIIKLLSLWESFDTNNSSINHNNIFATVLIKFLIKRNLNNRISKKY